MIDKLRDLLKKTWAIYKNNFLKIALIILAIWLPLLLLQHVWIEPTLKVDEAAAILQNDEIMKSAEHEDEVLFASKVTMLYGIVLILFSFLGIVSDIAVIKLTDQSHRAKLGKIQSSFNDIFSASVPLMLKCIWTYILVSFFVAFGIMMFIFPGIYIYVMSSLAISVAVLMGLSGRKAIKYSFAYVKDDVLVVALGILSLFMVNAVIVLGLEYISVYLPDHTAINLATTVVISVISKFVVALNVIFLAVFFCEKQAKLSSEHQQDKAPVAEL